MPNIKSAKKRVRVTEAKSLKNKAYLSALRTSIKKANVAIDNNSAEKDALAKDAIIKIDKAVTKGILHKNTAARKKSSIAVKVKA